MCSVYESPVSKETADSNQIPRERVKFIQNHGRSGPARLVNFRSFSYLETGNDTVHPPVLLVVDSIISINSIQVPHIHYCPIEVDSVVNAPIPRESDR